jgi:hypothetical protein
LGLILAIGIIIIFHIVTKPKSANCLPRPLEFIPAVRKLASLCASLGVKTLALPRIGAGLDRQPWHWVRKIIEEEFTGVATEVLIFNKPTEFPVNECRRLTYSQQLNPQPNFQLKTLTGRKIRRKIKGRKRSNQQKSHLWSDSQVTSPRRMAQRN